VSGPVNILFLSSEVTPYAKTGGLADVAGSLPGALNRLGINVSVGLPLYRSVKEGSFQRQSVLKGLNVPLAGQTLLQTFTPRKRSMAFPSTSSRGKIFSIANLYRTAEGDYYDNLERLLFSAAPRFCLQEPRAWVLM